MATMELMDAKLAQGEFEEGEFVYELTPEEEEELDKRIRESKAGLGIPHEIVMAEVREWLQARK